MSETRRRPWPVAAWLQSYSSSWLRPDILAGVTTAAVVAPKGMAYADIAGLPLSVGLYTACVPVLIYTLLGSSRPLSTSTTATIAILTGGAVSATGLSGGRALAAAVTLALMVGVFLVLAGALGLGFLGDFISAPVLTGFKAGIGVVIIVSQLGALAGVGGHGGHSLLGNIASVLGAPGAWHLPTLALGLASLIAILLLEHHAPRVPALLLAVAGGIAFAALADAGALGIAVVGEVRSGLPPLTAPDPALVGTLWVPALGIALIAFIESIAAARAFAARSDPPVLANRELFALGAANGAGSFFGAMPGGGGISQTAVNEAAGARSQAAQAVTAGIMLLVALLLGPMIALLPKATLAAVVIASAIGLVSLKEFRAILRVNAPEFRWAVAALLGVMFLDVLDGVVAAVVLSLVGLITVARKMPGVTVGRDPRTGRPAPISPDSPVAPIPGMIIVRPQGMIYFGTASILRDQITALVTAATEPIRVVLIDARTVPYLEYSGLKMLDELRDKLAASGVALWMANLQPVAGASLGRSPLGQALSNGAIYERDQDAIDAFERGARSSPEPPGGTPPTGP